MVSLRYIVCPNKTLKRYNTIAQQLMADGVTWYCCACGCDHYNNLTAAEVLQKVKPWNPKNPKNSLIVL